MNDIIRQFYIFITVLILASWKLVDIVMWLIQNIRGALCN